MFSFFKNACVYSLRFAGAFDLEKLNDMLSAFPFTPCGATDMSRTGWQPIIPGSDRYYHATGNHLLLVAQTQKKILPAPVVKDAVAARVDKLEQEQDRHLKSTEKATIKDEMIHTLLPRAFTRNSAIQMWIDLDNSRIVIDTVSARKAEEVLALLRKSMGSLPVVPMITAEPIELTLTEWIRSGELPAGFLIGEDAELVAILEHGGKMRCKKQELMSDEVRTHIEAGKVVTLLGLDWQERLTFRVSDNLTIKTIKFSDMLTGQNDDIDREDQLARMEADFILFTSEFHSFFSGLVQALGGEAKS